MAPRFADRAEAGRALADLLAPFAGTPGLRVLALPRGGVPVAFEVAKALRAPLDVFVVRKLGLPSQPEFAMGAIASGGVRVLNEDVVQDLRVSPAVIDAVAREEARELERREHRYRGGRPLASLRNATVVVVDDGLATGATMRAAVQALRGLGPRRIVVAVPVGAADTCETLRGEADEVVCARMPEPFRAVGLWYDVFDQTSDEEVIALLASSPSPV